MDTQLDKAILIRIGQNVRAQRKAQGLSQEQLAFECEMDRWQIARIEKGEHNTGILHLFHIAKVLEVPVSDLLNTE